MAFQLKTFPLLIGIAVAVIGAPQQSSIFDSLNSIDDVGDISDALADLKKDILRGDKENNSQMAKVQGLTMNATHTEVTLDDGRTLLVESPKMAMTFFDTSAIPKVSNCSCTNTETNRHHNDKPKDIPETSLKTRTNYKLGLKRFPGGIVTWTEKSKDSYNFVQIDNIPSHRPKYGVNMEWFHDSQWQLIPVLHEGNETGWYGLRNGGRKGAYLTFTPNNWINDHAYHVVLDKSYPGTHKKGDFFLKPVKMEDEDGEVYYRIKFMNLPSGVVTWSATKYGDSGWNYYIQADISTDPNHYNKYKVGGEWYEDTMFVFEEIKEERKVVVEEEIGDLERE